MSETEPTPQEAARRRRRWITFGETVAVLAVAISALTLWDNHSERRQAEAEKAASKDQEAGKAAAILLRATPEQDGARLALAPLAEDQAIQSQTIRFPAPLGLAPVETTGDPRIEAGWFASALAKARGDADDKRRGDLSLPVGIATRFLVDGAMRTDHAIYDLGYATEERFLRGDRVRLRGLSLVGRVAADGLQTKLDARWKAAAR